MLQVKLLRVLERRTFKRVGGTKDITRQPAHHRPPPIRTSSAWCRRDASARTSTTGSRWCRSTCRRCASAREDIVPLAQLFMDRFARQFKKPFTRHLAGGRAHAARLPVAGQHPRAAEPVRAHGAARDRPTLEPHHLKLAPRARRQPRSDARPAASTRCLDRRSSRASGIPFEALIEELERALILRASYATKWNQSRTAELLQLKRDKLRYRMKLYELPSRRRCGDERRGDFARRLTLEVRW